MSTEKNRKIQEQVASEDAAEQVRAHLVTLRGGAPFLSPFDGRLLLQWLEAGVSVASILLALEQAAERRRKKRSRVILSLRHARSAVLRQLKARVGAEGPKAHALGLKPLVDALTASEHVGERQAGADLAALTGEGEQLVEQAMQISRDFFTAAWEAADRESLRDAAREDLDDLLSELKPAQADKAIEEVARDLLRQRHPLLAASRIWDTVMG